MAHSGYERLADLFDMYNHSVGAMIYCIARMLEELEDEGDSEGVDRAKAAKKQVEQARSMEYDWRKQKRQDPLRRQGARRLDNELDRMIGNLVQAAEGFAAADVDSEPNRLAEEMLEDLFPDGVYHITSQTFDNQFAAVNELVQRLRQDYNDHVQKLNLTPMVDRIDELNTEFGDKLEPSGEQISYDEVEEAKVEAEDAFHHLVSHVMAQYGDDMETFNRIMNAVSEQSERARRHYQRRGTLPEVDPETGEPVEPTDESEGEGHNDGGEPTDEGESSGEGESTDDEQ